MLYECTSGPNMPLWMSVLNLHFPLGQVNADWQEGRGDQSRCVMLLHFSQSEMASFRQTDRQIFLESQWQYNHDNSLMADSISIDINKYEKKLTDVGDCWVKV